ncbi:MAG: diguanylate cyclase [Leptolyngbya sp. SIO1E4]|nr:diguanylate cyclase [Leptolyngbya sp. SIO1E4]
MPNSFKSWFLKATSKLSLQGLLILPFLLQTVGIVGLVGYLSYRTGQQAVNDLANQLIQENTKLVEARLDAYLETAHQINQTHQLLVQSGQLDLQDIGQIEQNLLAQLQQHPTASSVLYGDPQGTFRAFSRRENDQIEASFANPDVPTRLGVQLLDVQGEPLGRRKTLDSFPVTDSPWYQAAVTSGQPGWSPVFQMSQDSTFVIDAYQPVDDAQGLQGIFAVNLSLIELDKFLSTLEISQSGLVFVTEADGSLIATSTEDLPFSADGSEAQGTNLRRLRSASSQNSAIAQISQALQNPAVFNRTDPAYLQVNVNKERYFVHHQIYRDPYGLDWRITTALPSSHFIGQILASTQRTILLCVLALLGDLVFLCLISRWIAYPILRLHRGAKQLATGKFQRLPETYSFVELKELTHTFNDMAGQVKQSLDTMRSLTRKLLESEARLLTFLDALPVGVALHSTDGAVMYLNQVAQQLLSTDATAPESIDHLAKSQQAYRAGTDQPYPVSEMPAVQTLSGQSVVIDDLEIRRNETTIALEIKGTPIFDEHQQVTYAIIVFQDITLRKQAETVISDYNRALESQVLKRTLDLEKEIQERKRTEEQLRQSQATQQAILAAIPDILIRLNRDGIYLSCLSGDEITRQGSCPYHPQKSIFDKLPPDLTDLRMHYVRQALTTGQRQVYEHTIPFGETVLHEETRIVRLTDDEVLVMVRDITDRKQAEAQLHQANLKLEQLAETDALTQVANRRHFDRFLQEQWQPLNPSKQPLSLILLDIDYFKLFNDTYGHPAGDACLQQLVQAFQTVVQNPDYLVARYGGEEFGLILPSTSWQAAIALATQLRTAVQELAIPHTASPRKVVTISMGISCLVPTSQTSPAMLIKQTDQALYAAKQQGRHCYFTYKMLEGPLYSG